MGKITIYECDRCGTRFGTKNDVCEYQVKYISSDLPLEPHSVSQAICNPCLAEAGVDEVPQQRWYVAMVDGEVAGARYESGGRGNEYGAYRDIEDIPEKYQKFFEIVEETWNN